MQVLGMKPDQVTMLSVLSACAHLSTLDQAERIHLYVGRNHLEEICVSPMLICGNLERAREVIDKMQRRNVRSWTSMIRMPLPPHVVIWKSLKLHTLMVDKCLKLHTFYYKGWTETWELFSSIIQVFQDKSEVKNKIDFFPSESNCNTRLVLQHIL